MGIADNEAGLALFRFCHVYGLVKRLAAVAVNWADNLPAICHEALPNIFVKPGINMAVNRNTVGIIEENQLAKAPGSGKGGSLVGDAFHKTAIAAKSPGIMIDDFESRAIESCGQQFFGQGNADSGGYALPKRPGCHFNAGSYAAFGMPRRFGLPLAKVPDFLDWQIIAREVQKGI